METKLSTKGQIVLPQAIREARGWSAGQRFDIEDLGDGTVRLIPLGTAESTTVDDLMGCASYTGPRRSIEEMNEAIRRRLAGRR